MADEKILIAVDIDTEKMQKQLRDAIKNVSDLKEEQKRLTKVIEAGNDADGEQARKLIEVNKALDENKRQVKAQTALLQAAISKGIDENSTLDQKRQYLNMCQAAYGALTKEQKENTAAGKTLTQQIKELSDAVKDEEQKIGDARRNVGNYTESIQKALPDLGKMKGALEGLAGGSTEASKAIDGVDKVAKGFAANPTITIVFAIGSVLAYILDNLKKNEEAMEGINTISASVGGTLKALQPILDWLVKYLVEGLLAAINWVMDAIKSVLKWVDKLADKFGKSLNLAAAFEEGANAAKEMTEEEKKALEEQRKAEEKAAEERKKQREKEAQELAELREEMHKRNLSDLDRDLYDLKKQCEEELKTVGLTEEEKQNIRDYYRGQEEEARKKAQEKIDKEEEDALKKKEENEKKKLEARNKALEELGLSPEETPEMREMRLLEEARQLDLIDAQEYQAALTLIHDKYTKKREEETKREVEAATKLYKQSVMNASSATSAALSALSGLLGEYADSSEEAAKAQKAFAFGSILINQAMSIASGASAIAAAVEGANKAAAAGGPAAPFLAAAYTAEMVGQVVAMCASVASTIVQAKQIFGQSEQVGRYAGGTLLPGTYDGKDDVPAMLSHGEMVLNPTQASNALWNMANQNPMMTGYNYDAMAAAIRAGMASAPAPTLALTELREEQTRVATYNELASI